MATRKVMASAGGGGAYRIPARFAQKYYSDLRFVLGENRPDGIMVLPLKVLQDIATVKDLMRQGEIVFIPKAR
jgi:hypothetical protein